MIDRTIEPKLREVFVSVVAADSNRFERALKALDGDQYRYAANLALAIDCTVMSDLHDDPPTEERLNSLTRSFSKMQNWYDLGDFPVADYFRFLAGQSSGPIDPNVSALLAFLTGGWLLVAFLDGKTPWYEYLDDILNRLDEQPDI